MTSLTESVTGQLINAIEDVAIDLEDDVIGSQQESTPDRKARPASKLKAESNGNLHDMINLCITVFCT